MRYALILLTGILFYAWAANWWILVIVAQLALGFLYRPGSPWCIAGASLATLILIICKCSYTLPLAISFFSFEFIHYAVDSYQGKIADRSPIKYAAFIFFAPTLVCGPVKRHQDFLPKVDAAILSWANLEAGLHRLILGAFKKFVISDCTYLMTRNFTPEFMPGVSGVILWQSLLAYAIQIYFDFSGYSDMAIGTARIFGIVVPENFNRPYLAKDCKDYWQRWHMSLTAWIKTYLWIPLAVHGERQSWPRWIPVALTFAIIGLWHGIGWNFLIFGLLHGIGILYVRGRLVTIPYVIFCWIFFLTDTQHLPMALTKMFLLR